ncbi:hypothetical protein Poli38472_001692 [Pythium oligandrum]|uniref:Dienelactone hydrolase domain-containing protein n=1 Tax=Pythium oligandrum TaxID=41045 RepID=A0A8K1CVT9_PYTOL|nr:hypothetical protein Poli38472_001692 [Pythium oligandrum]|eukprot:TMW69536.1 hypothetical protein Poli38472_001692 [Pythium oligandrum]
MSSCCPAGSEPPRATSPHVGSIKRFGNTDLYITGPATAKVGIISYPDVFGYDSGRSKLDADRLAQEEGYAVVVVDVTGGNYMGMDSTMDQGAVWLKARDFNRDIKSHVEDAIVYLKQEAQVQAICTYGYCFGAWVGARVTVNADPVLKGHVSFHPSWIAELLLEGEGAVEKMTKGITIPQLLLAASNDPDFGRSKSDADRLAQEEGYVVVVVDVTDGNYMSTESTVQERAMCLKAQDFNQEIRPHVEDALAYLKQGVQVEVICSYGYCLGGWVGGRMSTGVEPLLKGHVSFHPSWIIETLFESANAVEKMTKAITVPQLLLSASNDPDFVREGGSGEQILKAKPEIGSLSGVVNFDDVVHGWVNHGDLNDPKVKASVDEAWSRARAFFKSVL